MKQLHLFSLPRPIICTYRVKQGYRTALIDIILFSSVIGAYTDTRNWTLLFVLLGPELSASGRSTCVLCVHFFEQCSFRFCCLAQRRHNQQRTWSAEIGSST